MMLASGRLFSLAKCGYSDWINSFLWVTFNTFRVSLPHLPSGLSAAHLGKAGEYSIFFLSIFEVFN
jgi:hypothetical protein